MSLVGELNDLGLSDIFQILALSQRTGTLVVTTPTYVGQVLFASGLIVGGGLSAHSPTLGAHLVAQGVLAAPKLADLAVAERRGTGGLALLALCGPDPAPILAAMETLLRSTMGQLLEATQGSFSFENAHSLDPWPHFSVLGTMALFPAGLKAQYLAMEVLRQRDEAHKDGAPTVPAADAAPTLGRPQALAQALRGGEGPQEDDWSALLSEADALLTPAPAPLSAPSAPAPLPVPGTALADLRDVVQQLRHLPPGTDPCALLLRALRLHCERGAYFAIVGQKLVAQGGFGPGDGPAAAGGAQPELQILPGSAPHVAIVSGQPCLQPLAPTEAHRALLAALGGGWHDGAVLIAPWQHGQGVVGLLVGDNPSGRPLVDAPGVDILVAQAGLGASAAPASRP